MKNQSDYLSNEEYSPIFFSFCSFRQKIASKLIKFGLLSCKYVLDLAAGHGFLSFAIRDCGYKGNLIDIGLFNDLNSYKRVIENNDFQYEYIQYIVMNSSKMAFLNDSFDMIINFLGLEDINMTIGKEGVISTLSEMSRILRKNGILEIVLMQKGTEPSSILNWELWEFIGLNSLFYAPDFYIKTLENYGFKLEEKFILKTNKKLTLNQAKEETLFACNEAPKIFSRYNVRAKSFEEVWSRFSLEIEKFGLGFYSEILVLIFRKI